jgi:hypothetical protein
MVLANEVKDEEGSKCCTHGEKIAGNRTNGREK